MKVKSSFAVVADIHGNASALRAVLADVRTRGIDRIVNLGDNANGPLQPAEAVALLRETCAVHVRGNGDRMVGSDEAVRSLSVPFARERLSAADRAWLGGLPATVATADWFACHGGPGSDTEYLLEQIVDGRVVLREEAAIAASLAAVEQRLVLCGHTHLPRCVRLRDGRVVVNPGSVGLPAYDDDQPEFHRVETGSPHARYAIVTQTAGDWAVELRAMPYDWDAAARLATAAGFASWAAALTSGRA